MTGGQPVRLRRDPLSGRLAAVAPARSLRPGATAGTEEPTPEPPCPFCAGREAETPPETFALGPAGRIRDSPGWTVRVVPNKYPAVEEPDGRHEVVVHTPRHALTLADLTAAELAGVAAAWQARSAAAGGLGFCYVHALLNEGRAAGGSLPHTHSQLVWLAEPPPAVVTERAGGPDCAVCRLIACERAAGERMLVDGDGIVSLCPPASRAPYELLVAPAACEANAFTSDSLAPAIAVLAAGIRALRHVEGPAPLNAWLHTGSSRGEPGHWHLELVPRLTVPAGLELGAGLYVNPLPPETAAARLRSP